MNMMQQKKQMAKTDTERFISGLSERIQDNYFKLFSKRQQITLKIFGRELKTTNNIRNVKNKQKFKNQKMF